MDDTPKLAYNEGRLEDARRLLLEEYAEKPVRRLIQLDACGDGELFGGEAYELRNLAGTPSIPVRVQVCEGADKQQVIALLNDIIEWVDRGWENMHPERVQQLTEEVLAGRLPRLRRVK